MEPDGLDVNSVDSLGVEVDLGNKGNIIFSKSRVGNGAFFLWFTREHLIPFVQMIKKSKKSSSRKPFLFCRWIAKPSRSKFIPTPRSFSYFKSITL